MQQLGSRSTRIERWVKVVWAVALGWTALSFGLPGIASGIVVLLTFTLVGIPIAKILTFLPTVALYLSVATPMYMLLARHGRIIAALAAIVTSLAIGSFVSIRSNQALEQNLVDLTKANKPGRITLTSGQTVAYLYDYPDDFNWYRGCDEHCQRLLFSGAAQGVVLGDTSSLKGKGRLRRYWLSDDQDACPEVWVPDIFASDQDVDKNAPFPRPTLISALKSTQCVNEAPATLDEADVILAQWFHPTRGNAYRRRFDARLVRVTEVSATAIYRRFQSEFRVVHRQVHAGGSALRVPLGVDAPFVFATYAPGHWTRSAHEQRGRQPGFGLNNFVTNDLRVPVRARGAPPR